MRTLTRKGSGPVAAHVSRDDVEHDITVRMPPKRRYTVKLKITSIRKATPNIAEPEQV